MYYKFINLFFVILLPILYLSVPILIIKSIRYENNTLVFDNKSQYDYFYAMLWLSFPINMFVAWYVAILSTLGGIGIPYFILYMFFMLIFTISVITILNGNSSVDDLTVYLPNEYIIFILIISWFLLIGIHLYPLVLGLMDWIKIRNKKPLTSRQIERKRKRNKEIQRYHLKRKINELEK
jgi:hypothetical protein